jgi:hypothetical protein
MSLAGVAVAALPIPVAPAVKELPPAAMVIDPAMLFKVGDTITVDGLGTQYRIVSITPPAMITGERLI